MSTPSGPAPTGQELVGGVGGRPVRLGLRNNTGQFALLALVNLFVGGMVGLERTVTPLVGTEQFGLTEVTVSMFVVAFGVTKALTNLYGGLIINRFTRKTVLTAGWVIGLPVPLMLAYGTNWWWVIAANVLLGVNQGLTWSMTVNMKIDLVGPRNRGLALGINETAGYLGVAVTTLLTGALATSYGLRPVPELLGVAYAVAGLLLTVLVVRDTGAHAELERRNHPSPDPGTSPALREIVAETSWRNRTAAGASQAGLVNNLNDGLTWVILPLLLVAHAVSVDGVGLIKALYPFLWAVGMLGTGWLADRIGRKLPSVVGMWVQATGLVVIVAGLAHPLAAGMAGSLLLGIGTALVYPALLAVVSDAIHPSHRSAALGVYRFWRDAGYAIGALVGGLVAAFASLEAAILTAAALTAASAIAAQLLMAETNPTTDASHATGGSSTNHQQGTVAADPSDETRR
ncbi:MFS transporter [Actinomycetospora lemnae]|uniref:MFS transporter n=1 Tax=Actinomycetospora lemnae TaxID=3019891 RepID=A0ABT5SY75_9PSEU|nr:MFS transporter [Actinomycetospora sp. DW7H6]MDD7967815.1 MFS transporter [Actinomycetospora sp. DW7H6]